MENIVIDFTYANKGQKEALERFKSNNSTNNQDKILSVPMGLILALQSGLSKVLIESKLDMFWSKSEVDNKLLIQSLAGFLANMGDLANFLEVDLIAEVQEIHPNISFHLHELDAHKQSISYPVLAVGKFPFDTPIR